MGERQGTDRQAGRKTSKRRDRQIKRVSRQRQLGGQMKQDRKASGQTDREAGGKKMQGHTQRCLHYLIGTLAEWELAVLTLNMMWCNTFVDDVEVSGNEL